MEPYSI